MAKNNVVRLTPRIPGSGLLDVVNRKYVLETIASVGGGLVWIGQDPGPPNPVSGQLWWRSDPDGVLYIFYDDGTSSQWVPASPGAGGGSSAATVPIQATPPANAQPGQLWVRNEPDFKLYVLYNDGTSTQWVGL
jgi:hypothetical protein